MKFKPGDQVKFKGLKVDHLKVNIPEIEGELMLNDENTSIKGVMSIKGDTYRMAFCPDGTIYCHPGYGRLLTKKRKASQ